MLPIRKDQISIGLDRLIHELKDKDAVEKMLSLFLTKVQEIEEAGFELLEQRGIFEAVGFQLDVIGKILGVKRLGLEDEPYRTALLLKIASNNADGTPNNLISLVKQYSGSDNVQLREGVIAFGSLIVNGAYKVDGGLWQLVQNAKPLGSQIIIHSDYTGNAFRPAFEKSLANEEPFQTSNDGVIFENFETSDDGFNFETFFVGTSGVEYHPPSLSNPSLYFEEPVAFNTSNDGVNFEPLIINGTPFKVMTPYNDDYIPKDITPLTWEVAQNSVTPST